VRDSEVVRLTRDHSLVNELIERGKLTEEQAETHPQRSVITRALGPEASVQVDLETFQARDGDVFLVCSDGLTSMIPESRLAPILTRSGSLEEAGHALIDAANDAGGRDNITVVLFRLQEVAGTGAAAVASHSDADTSEYDASDHGRLQSNPPAGDETEANYRRQGTMAMSAVRPRAEPEEHPPRPAPPARAERPRPRRRRRLRLPVGLVVVALFAFIVVAGFWTASRVVYFVGTDPQHGDAVTIYQGLPYELPFGIRLYSRHAGSGVTLPEVPPARRRTFTDHKLRSLDDAENLVNALETGKLQP
jgi:protein phosphatase